MHKNLKKAFLNNKFNNILNYNFPDFDILPVLNKYKNFPAQKRLLLQKVLHQQNKNLPNYEYIKPNIDLLGNSNTFTITTGQQAGLLGGPLYTLYKAATVVFLANKLKKQFPNYNFVPVFWIASNDHDYKEVNHAYINPFLKIIYEGNFENKPVGTHIIKDKLKIENQLENSIIPENIIPADILNFWEPGNIWWEAFAKTLAFFLGKYGLVFLNPLDKELKSSAKSLFAEVIEHDTFYKSVVEQSQWLKNHNYKLQIKPNRYPLFKITTEGRVRFNSSPENSDTLDPDVSLRPLFQQTILPNIIYVGGWGEINYWMQLVKAFKKLNVPMPVIIPRNSYILIPGVFKNVEKLGVSHYDLLKPFPEIRKIFAKNYIDTEGFALLKTQSEELIKNLKDFDVPNSEEMLKSFIRRTNMNISRLEEKYYKHISRWQRKKWLKILQYKNELIPEKQERIWSIPSLYYYNVNIDKLINIITSEYSYNTKVVVI